MHGRHKGITCCLAPGATFRQNPSALKVLPVWDTRGLAERIWDWLVA